MNNLQFFINNRMKVLLIIYEHQVKIENYSFCPLNQQEIAELVPCSKLKVNQILKELIHEGYAEMVRCRGRYILSPKGNHVVKQLML